MGKQLFGTGSGELFLLYERRKVKLHRETLINTAKIVKKVLAIEIEICYTHNAVA